MAILKNISHPHLLKYYGAGHAEGTKEVYIVTELLHADLKAVLRKKSGPPSWKLRVRMMRDVASALAYLHQNA